MEKEKRVKHENEKILKAKTKKKKKIKVQTIKCRRSAMEAEKR